MRNLWVVGRKNHDLGVVLAGNQYNSSIMTSSRLPNARVKAMSTRDRVGRMQNRYTFAARCSPTFFISLFLID